MHGHAHGPFPLGKSATTISSGYTTGMVKEFYDRDYAAASGGDPNFQEPLTGNQGTWILCKNDSGGTLTGGTAVKFDWTSAPLREISAVAGAEETPDGVLDPFLSSTLANGSYAWVCVFGVTKVTTANSTAIAAGDPIKTAASGQIVEALSPDEGTTFGRMLEATSASATKYRAFINCQTMRTGNTAESLSTTVTDSAVTITRAAHGNKVIVLNRAAGIAVTLPAATGTGVKYTFIVQATFTGAASIAVASATDYMIGAAWLTKDSADTTDAFETANTGTVATESDTIDMFETGNTTGGVKGAIYELTDIASAIWHVRIHSAAGGTEASPFSAAV